MAATDLLSRGTPTRDEIVDMLSGHLCRCTGYAPIVDAIEEVAASVNLAQSLLAACERHPELEAFPGIPYGELLPRVRRIAGGLGVNEGERVAVVLDNRLETALLYWACQWAGAVAVPLSWRLSEDDLGYCLEDCGAALVIRDGDPFPDGPEHSGALDRDERETSLLLYTSGTTGRPKGVPRSHAADRAGRLVAGAPARLRVGRPDARRDAALPHDGHPFARRDAPRRRLLRPAGALGRRRGARADRQAAHHVALPRADALPRPRPPPRRRVGRRLVRARARLRGRRDDVDPRASAAPRSSGPRSSSTTTARPRSTRFTIGRDQLGEARLRGPPGRQHAAAPRRVGRDPRRARLGRGVLRATGTGPTPTRRRSRTAGTAPATPGTWTRTATCGSTGGSTT